MASHHTGPVRHTKRTNGDRKWFSELPVSQDPDYAVYFNDFLATQDFAAADWTITTVEAGGGDATEAIGANELNGSLLITNDANDNDSDSLQQNEETWKLETGKQHWFEMNMKVGDADDVDLFVGLGITDTTPLVTTDRIGFDMVDANASVRSLTEKDSTETNNDTGVDLVDDTYIKLGFWFDGAGKVEFYVNRALVATHNDNIPDDENLAITMHVQNGSANANTLEVDYIFVAKER